MPNRPQPTRRPRVPSKRITLAEVATASGVAVSTVSHILNDRPSCYASQETRNRVTEAARRLGYRPNLAARALRGGMTGTLGFITTALDVEPTSRTCMAFEDAARKQGHLVIMSFSPNDALTEDRQIMWLRDRSVDAMGVFPCEHGRHEQLRRLAEERFPVVTFDAAGSLDFPIDDISVDYALGGRLQAEHLLEIGRRRIGMAVPDFSCRVVDLRLNAVRQTLAMAADVTLTELTMHLPEQMSVRKGRDAYPQIAQFLAQTRGQLDAFVAPGDIYALDALKAAWTLGIRVPEDLAIIGFDGIGATESATIPITTIEHPAEEKAELGYKRLGELLEGDDHPPRQVLVKPSLIVRASTVGS